MLLINIICALAVVVAVVSWVYFIIDLERYARFKKGDNNGSDNKNK